MLFATSRGSRRVEYDSTFDSSVPIPRASQYGGAASYAGQRVTYEAALGLPAFLRGVRLIAETTAMMPINISRGYGNSRIMQPDAAQLEVLHNPNDDMTRFEVWSYALTSMIRGNCYLFKQYNGSAVEALWPLSPEWVRPKYVKGKPPTFEVRTPKAAAQTFTSQTFTDREILHIPGILVDDANIGVSVVTAYRQTLGTQLARQEFEGRYVSNDGAPSIALKHPGNPTEEQRTAIRMGYENRHNTVRNAGRPAMVWGGWDITPLAVSARDQQFIESMQFGVKDVARMLGVPADFLDADIVPRNYLPEQDNSRLLRFGVQPWMSRLEQGLAHDPDLFPVGRDFNVEFDPSELLRADIKTRFEAWRLARQGGWISANEIRIDEGREPVAGGDEIQQTPVGGAPNAAPDNSTAPTQDAD